MTTAMISSVDDRPVPAKRSSIYSYLSDRFGVDVSAKSPIELPNIGREGFAEMLGAWGCRVGCEVGVERGEYLATLARVLLPGGVLYGVDAWQSHVGYRDHVRQNKLDRFYAETCARFEQYPNVHLIRKFSVEAAKDIPGASLDFVYIDANHALPFVIADLHAWSYKVRPGGIVAGHDFIHHKWPNQMHVTQAIHAWTDAYDIKPWFVLGRKDKVPGEVRDDGRSWFWVHEPRPAWRKGMGKPIKQ